MSDVPFEVFPWISLCDSHYTKLVHEQPGVKERTRAVNHASFVPCDATMCGQWSTRECQAFLFYLRVGQTYYRKASERTDEIRKKA